MAGAISELPVPQGGAVAALPVPGEAVDPAQAEDAAFRATAGTARRGFRSGMLNVGQMVNNLIGQSAEALGLTEFANDRFNEAKNYAARAEAVAPNIRDVGQVKDLSNLVDFVAGHAGSGVATSIPVLAAAIGLRRPTLGVVGGAGALEAGEQVGSLRDNPNVMRTATPGDILKNSLIKGGIAGVMEAAGGATGQAARTLLKPTAKTLAHLPKEVLKGTLGEAVTEAGQDVTGQVMEQQLDPTKAYDPMQTVNAAAAGAAGGGAITAGAAVASAVPGVARDLAKSADELRGRLGKKEAPPDPMGVPPEAMDPNTPFERVMELVTESEDKFAKAWSTLKERPEFANLKDVDITDPENLSKVYKAAKDKWNETEVAPKVQGALDYLRQKFKEGQAKVGDAGKVKKSREWTQMHVDIHDKMMESLPEDVIQSMEASPEQLLELADHIVNLAKDPEVAANTATARVLTRVMGPKFREVLDYAIERVHGEEAPREEGKAKVKEAFERKDVIDRHRAEKAKEIIYNHLKPGYQVNRPMREAALDKLVPQMLDYLDQGGAGATAGGLPIDASPRDRVGAGSKTRERSQGLGNTEAGAKTPGDVAIEKNTPQWTEFRDALDEAFGDKSEAVLDALDELSKENPGRIPGRRVRTQSEAFQSAESQDSEHTADTTTKELSDEEAGPDAGASKEDVEAGKSAASKMAEDPKADKRFGVPIKGMDEAKRQLEDMRAEYRSRTLKLKVTPLGEDKYAIVAEDSDQQGLSPDELERVWEGPQNKSGFKEGILVINTPAAPQGKKVNLVALTRLMMQREGQQTQEGRASYVADMFSRGLSALLVTQVEHKGKTVDLVTDIKIEKDKNGRWQLPDDTRVAVTRAIDKNGKPLIGKDGKPVYERWTYKQVREAGFGGGRAAMLRRAAVEEAKAEYGPAKWEGPVKNRKPVNPTAKAVRELSDYYDQIKDARLRVSTMSDDALIGVQDGEREDSALLPMHLSRDAVDGRIKMIEKVSKKSKEMKELLADELRELRLERSLLDNAISHVEREAESIRKPEPSADQYDELNALQESRQVRGHYDELTGAPLHNEPAQGPRGQLTGKEGNQRVATSAAPALRKQLGDQHPDVLAEEQRMREAAPPLPGRAGTKNVPAFPELTQKNLPPLAYEGSPEQIKRDAAYRQRHPQGELGLVSDEADAVQLGRARNPIAIREGEQTQREREQEVALGKTTGETRTKVTKGEDKFGKPAEATEISKVAKRAPKGKRQLSNVDVLNEMIQGRKLLQDTEKNIDNRKPSVRELSLAEQKKAGWDTNWPFVPIDLANADFRKQIANDPELSAEEKERIFAAGKKLGVVPASERGPKKSLMANKVAKETGQRGIPVTHDSPIKHAGEFDWRKNAGKGEGMMAVGAGSYFSTDDNVHHYYKGKFNEDGTATVTGSVSDDIKNILSYTANTLSPDIGSRSIPSHRVLARAIRDLEKDINATELNRKQGVENFLTDDEIHDLEDTLVKLKQVDPKSFSVSYAYKKAAPSYHAVIDADPEQLMDWNAPLSEQSDYVKAALKSIGLDKGDKVKWVQRKDGGWVGSREDGEAVTIEEQEDSRTGKEYVVVGQDSETLMAGFATVDAAKQAYEGSDLTGALIYRNLSRKLGGDREASDALQEAGIVGHSYPVGTATGNTRTGSLPNYVVYDDKKVKTLFVEFSKMNVGKGPISEDAKARVRAYVESVLGKDAKVLFEKLDHAGEFSGMSGEEVLKVAVDAIDPMSVGRHEALHAFFSRLMAADKKAAHTLLRAASAAPVVARLKQLLKGHPDALRQITPEGQLELDPSLTKAEAEAEAAEERLAYMYQFWAAKKGGLLAIGPETKTWFDKVKAFFRVLTGLWADEMNSALDTERAGAILDAFHNGAFAERSTVAKVMQEKFPGDPRESMAKSWPAIGRIADKFLWTAMGSVRDMNMTPLTEIMNKFHLTADASGKNPGWLQAKHSEFNRRVNKVVDTVKGKTEEEQRAILDELRSGSPRTSPEAKAIEAVLAEALVYMQRSGVKEIEGFEVINGKPQMKYRDIDGIEKYYFPRVFNHDAVRKGKDEFIALLKKYKVGEGDPTKQGDVIREEIWEEMSKGVSDANPRDDGALGVTLFTPNIKRRGLYFIPDAELAPYLNQDLFGTMSTYLARAARRAEYAKRFGNAGEAIDDAVDKAKELGMTRAQEATFQDSVHAMEGTLGSNMSMPLRQAYAAITTYQNIRLLPLALFSSLVDPLGIAVRGGTMAEAFAGFTRGIRDLAKLKEDDAYHLAKTVGAINAANDAQVVGDMYSSQFMPEFLRNVNEKFFRYNGMESWNRSMRVAAAAAAERFIIRHVEDPTEDSARYLKELNLEAGDVDIRQDKIVLNAKTTAAINLWVDQAIIRPNAALRPIYMSDPNWILISHLKQYTYMFQKVILARVYHELKHGDPLPMMVLAGYVPMIIASDMMRVALTPGQGDDRFRAGWTAWDWIWRGMQRAGLFGPGQFALDAGAGGGSFSSLAGPTLQQLSDFLGGSLKGQMGTELLKAVPGAKQLVL